jgi:1,2-diacylglycerol 3-alpha-glucosyltransferase
MKVGIFTDSYVPRADGIAIASDIMGRGVADLGHDTYVFCPSRPGASYEDKRVITYPSAPAFLVYEGLRVAWPFGHRRLEYIRRLNLDVIHIQLPFMVGFAGMRAARKLGIPLVMTCHQDLDLVKDYHGSAVGVFFMALAVGVFSRDFKGLLGLLLGPPKNRRISRRDDFTRRTYAFMTDKCDAVIAPSKKVFDQLQPYSSRKNLVIVPNGIRSDILPTLSKKQARHQLDIAPTDEVIITTSRLVREKRIEEVITALSMMSKAHPHCRLYVLGDGPERRKLETLASDLNLNNKVIFTGNVPLETVFTYLRASDVYVNACMREVASLSAMEAGASGLPVIARDSRLQEVLIDGESGFFVNSSREMADKLLWLLDDPKRLRKFGRNGKKLTMATHGMPAHARSLAAVYESIL